MESTFGPEEEFIDILHAQVCVHITQYTISFKLHAQTRETRVLARSRDILKEKEHLFSYH
jgi:hypothetical protein